MIRGFPCARCRGLVVAVVCTCCLFAPVVAPAVALPDDQPHVEITSDEPPAIYAPPPGSGSGAVHLVAAPLCVAPPVLGAPALELLVSS
jgi:hypothetical protein